MTKIDEELTNLELRKEFDVQLQYLLPSLALRCPVDSGILRSEYVDSNFCTRCSIVLRLGLL